MRRTLRRRALLDTFSRTRDGTSAERGPSGTHPPRHRRTRRHGPPRQPPMNAFDAEQRVELARLRARTGRSRAVRAVVLYGGERSSPRRTSRPGRDGTRRARGWNRALQRTFDEVARLPMPSRGGHRVRARRRPELACARLPSRGRRRRPRQPEVRSASCRAQRTQRLARRSARPGEEPADDRPQSEGRRALRLGLVDEVVPQARRTTRRCATPGNSRTAGCGAGGDQGGGGPWRRCGISAGLAWNDPVRRGLAPRTPPRGIRSFIEHGPGTRARRSAQADRRDAQHQTTRKRRRACKTALARRRRPPLEDVSEPPEPAPARGRRGRLVRRVRHDLHEFLEART